MDVTLRNVLTAQFAGFKWYVSGGHHYFLCRKPANPLFRECLMPDFTDKHLSINMKEVPDFLESRDAMALVEESDVLKDPRLMHAYCMNLYQLTSPAEGTFSDIWFPVINAKAESKNLAFLMTVL